MAFRARRLLELVRRMRPADVSAIEELPRDPELRADAYAALHYLAGLSFVRAFLQQTIATAGATSSAVATWSLPAPTRSAA